MTPITRTVRRRDFEVCCYLLFRIPKILFSGCDIRPLFYQHTRTGKNITSDQRPSDTTGWKCLIRFWRMSHFFYFSTFTEAPSNRVDKIQSIYLHLLKLVKKRCNTTQRLNTFSMRIVDHWNNLSEDTVTANSINIFKSRLNEGNWNENFTRKILCLRKLICARVV